ncbi:hypothetical protein HY418_02175 [Candidatus Kaiserbacteria bacterium]|nr:hypothetical protein [Candidatus Kaiserbacteria bacterium]
MSGVPKEPKETPSRGLSIVAGIFLVAVAGSVVMAFKLVPFFPPDRGQSALAAVSADGGNSVGAPAGQADSKQITDELPPGSVRIGNEIRTVYYACTQQVKNSGDLATLKQTCQPGFLYTIYESQGVVSVLPDSRPGSVCPASAPDAGKKCSLENETPKKSCPSSGAQEGVVYYVIPGQQPTLVGNCSAGKPIDLKKGRISGLESTLSAADPSQRQTIMNEAGLPPAQQDALLSAYKEDAATQTRLDAVTKQQADVAGRLQALANCPDYACTEKQALNEQAAALAQQQKDLQAQTLALKNNEVSLLAGENPAAPDASSPQGQSFGGGGSAPTFSSSAEGEVSTLSGGGQSLWSKVKDAASSIGVGVQKASCELIGLGCSAQAGIAKLPEGELLVENITCGGQSCQVTTRKGYGNYALGQSYSIPIGFNSSCADPSSVGCQNEMARAITVGDATPLNSGVGGTGGGTPPASPVAKSVQTVSIGPDGTYANDAVLQATRAAPDAPVPTAADVESGKVTLRQFLEANPDARAAYENGGTAGRGVVAILSPNDPHPAIDVAATEYALRNKLAADGVAQRDIDAAVSRFETNLSGLNGANAEAAARGTLAAYGITDGPKFKQGVAGGIAVSSGADLSTGNQASSLDTVLHGIRNFVSINGAAPTTLDHAPSADSGFLRVTDAGDGYVSLSDKSGTLGEVYAPAVFTDSSSKLNGSTYVNITADGQVLVRGADGSGSQQYTVNAAGGSAAATPREILAALSGGGSAPGGAFATAFEPNQAGTLSGPGLSRFSVNTALDLTSRNAQSTGFISGGQQLPQTESRVFSYNQPTTGGAGFRGFDMSSGPSTAGTPSSIYAQQSTRQQPTTGGAGFQGFDMNTVNTAGTPSGIYAPLPQGVPTVSEAYRLLETAPTGLTAREYDNVYTRVSAAVNASPQNLSAGELSDRAALAGALSKWADGSAVAPQDIPLNYRQTIAQSAPSPTSIAWSDLSLTSPLPTTPAPSVAPASNLPLAFQAVQALPESASLQTKIAALGTYQERSSLVKTYLGGDLSNYRGTASQNARLVQLAEQYGASPPIPKLRPSTPTETASVPTPVTTVPTAFVTPTVDVGRIRAAAQSYNGNSIVDFCRAAGYSSCSSEGTDRLYLVQLVGLSDYAPTYQGNTELLDRLRSL